MTPSHDPGPSDPDRPATPVPPSPLRSVEAAVARLFRWTWERARSFYGAAGLVLTLALILSALLSWGFVELAAEVVEGDTRALDIAAIRWMEARATPLLDTVALEVTQLGSNPVLFMTVVIAATVFWVTEHRFSAVSLLSAVTGSMVLNYLLKLAFSRPRPDLLDTLKAPVSTGLSFPSGHAMTTLVTYLSLAYLLGRLLQRRRARLIATAIAAVVVLLVGASRVYLGVHFPSDVLAGYAAGFIWATLCVLLIRVADRFPEPKAPGV